MAKRVVGVLALFLVGIVAFKVVHDRLQKARPFAKELVTAARSYEEWRSPPLTEEERAELYRLAAHPFTFLGEGAQAYAFESFDKKFVLKVFKMRRLSPSWSDYLCPHILKSQKKNREHVLGGHKIAFEELRKETGLVFAHLAKTSDLESKALVIDRNGKPHTLDLDSVEFVIQKKAELIFEHLGQFQGEEREKKVEAVLKLVRSWEEKGLRNRDPAITNNIGFVDGDPILLDVGRLYRVGERRKAKAAGWQEERLRRRLKKR